jgi:DNA repair photolyase
MSETILIREVKAKSILNKTGIPNANYCINPYTGCAHGCIYCYATYMRDYSGHTEEWGKFVDVKINLAEILSKEIKKKKPGRICIGTVADGYQPIEREKLLTRKTIELLIENNFPFEILTKSSLVSRDVDLLKNYKNCSVELSITTIDDKVRKIFEPNADTIENRLACAKKLISAGIETNVFFGPVLPYFSDNDKSINSLFDAFESAGVKRVLVDKLNYPNKKIPLILSSIKDAFPQAINYYQNFLKSPNGYETDLRQRINEIAKSKHMNVEVVF